MYLNITSMYVYNDVVKLIKPDLAILTWDV